MKPVNMKAFVKKIKNKKFYKVRTVLLLWTLTFVLFSLHFCVETAQKQTHTHAARNYKPSHASSTNAHELTHTSGFLFHRAY